MCVARSDFMTAVTIRSATDDDWPAIWRLAATGFGWSDEPEAHIAWRAALTGGGGTIVACDGDELVGNALYLDLRLTVPGPAVVPAAGISIVVVAPTHRRRGILRAMYDELHRRIADAGYPIAALTASEGGIYWRFGYGPATIETELSIDRRFAGFYPDAPDPGGVRLIDPGQHRGVVAEIYDRWRRQTPGGLERPRALFDDLLADRRSARGGGSPWFALLHPDGYVLYRVHGDGPKTVRIGEFTAATPAAHAALWRAVLGLDLMTTVVVDTHPDDPLPYLLTDARLAATTARRDGLWLRTMNIPAALQARRYAAEFSAVLGVFDEFRGDGGRFALEITDGHARCTPTAAPADVELGIDVLGGLYLGAHRATTLAAADRLRTDDPKLPHRLDAAFVSVAGAQLGFHF